MKDAPVISKYNPIQCVLRRLCLPERYPHRQILHWFFTKQSRIYTYMSIHLVSQIHQDTVAQDSTISVFSGGKTIQTIHDVFIQHTQLAQHSVFIHIFTRLIGKYNFLMHTIQTSISFIFHPDTSNCVHNLHQKQQKYIQNFTIYSTTLHIKAACFPQLFTRSTFQSSNGAMFSNALKLPFYSIHVFTVGNTTCTASLLSYKQKRKMLEAYVIVLRCNLSK